MEREDVQNRSKKVKFNDSILKNKSSIDSVPSSTVSPILDPSDFLAAEANDNSKPSLNALGAIYIKPVSIFRLWNLYTGKTWKKPLMVLLDTGSEKSVVKPEHTRQVL